MGKPISDEEEIRRYHGKRLFCRQERFPLSVSVDGVIHCVVGGREMTDTEVRDRLLKIVPGCAGGIPLLYKFREGRITTAVRMPLWLMWEQGRVWHTEEGVPVFFLKREYKISCSFDTPIRDFISLCGGKFGRLVGSRLAFDHLLVDGKEAFPSDLVSSCSGPDGWRKIKLRVSRSKVSYECDASESHELDDEHEIPSQAQLRKALIGAGIQSEAHREIDEADECEQKRLVRATLKELKVEYIDPYKSTEVARQWELLAYGERAIWAPPLEKLAAAYAPGLFDYAQAIILAHGAGRSVEDVMKAISMVQDSIRMGA
jgi:hypothetical protein